VVFDGPKGRERVYRTGDVVRRCPDGAFAFVGRVDRQVKISGKRVELDEIEHVLRRCGAVADAAVIATEPVPGAKRVVAFVTAQDANASQAEFVANLRRELCAMVPEHLIPSEVVLSKALPLTPQGKVDRAALTGLAAADTMRHAAQSPTQTPVFANAEGALRAAFLSVLGRNDLPADITFFDFGARSLDLIKVHAAVQISMARAFPFSAFFEHATIMRLSAYLDGPAADAAEPRSGDQRGESMRAAIARARARRPGAAS